MRGAPWLMILAGCGDNTPRRKVPTIFSPDESAQICMTLQACFPIEWQGPAWGSSLFSCTTNFGYIPQPGTLVETPFVVRGFEAGLTRIYHCVLTAMGDCSATAACLAGAGLPDTCTADALEHGACNETVLSGCTADGFAFSTDCASDGERCAEYPALSDPFNGCVLGVCPVEPGCRGSFAEACIGDVVVLEDCAAYGNDCVAGACVGDVCDPTRTANHCEGSEHVSCGPSGLSRFDCADQPTRQRCETNPSGSTKCALTGTECTGEVETCDGDDVVFCRDGSTVRHSCAALGFHCEDGRCSQ